jgi:HlyD family secretion protein
VLRGGGFPSPVPIQIGLTDGSVTEVLSGDLHEGDELVTETLSAEGSGQSGGASGASGGSRRPSS